MYFLLIFFFTYTLGPNCSLAILNYFYFYDIAVKYEVGNGGLWQDEGSAASHATRL